MVAKNYLHTYIFDTAKKVHDRKWIILGQTCLAFTRSPLLPNISSIQSCSKTKYFYHLLPLCHTVRVSEKLKFVSNISFLYQYDVRNFIMLFPLSRLPSYQVTHQSLLHFVHWISETQFIWNFWYCLTDPTLLATRGYQIWYSDQSTSVMIILFHLKLVVPFWR